METSIRKKRYIIHNKMYLIVLFVSRDSSIFQDFPGNTDSDTVKRNSVPIPVLASSVFILPLTVHKNVGLRLELYGCKGGIYSDPFDCFDCNFFNQGSLQEAL